MQAPQAPPWRRSEQGFTLIEALVATTILAVALTGLLAGFVETYRTTRASGRASVLAHVAAEKLEELALLAYTHADLTNGTHPAQGTDSQGRRYYPFPGLDENYSVRWIVSAGPTNGAGTAVAQMKTIVVEATFGVRYTTSGTVIAAPGGQTVTLRSFRSE